jgi:glucosamine--fructose-6-phosphate aminotransferase (isomerizing)
MCGIYGCVGTNAISKTLNGIKKLEYRGYDSAGIGFFSYDFKLNPKINKFEKNVKCFSSGLNVVRSEGEISKLEKVLNELKPKSQIAIGHTRWATHGKPSEKNSHPHYSENGNWVVVHNGIIENYVELKNELKGLKFYSETDTEIVAKMLSYNFDGDVLRTIKSVCDKLNGSYAFAIIYAETPNTIYVAKNNSPCVVGVEKI